MMYFNIIVVLGLLGCSLGVPVDQPTPYNPQDFFRSSQRIVGGTDAPDNYAPHMVALLVGDIVASLICGGSLVARDKVLTAAHCIEAMWNFFPVSSPDSDSLNPIEPTHFPLLPSARAVFGTNKWADERRTSEFSGYKNHPEYDRWFIKNDVGVLFMIEPVKLDHRVSVIPLNYNFVGGGENSSVTGWGTTIAWGSVPDKLQLLYVETLSPEQCKDALKKAEAELLYIPPMDSKVEICTMHKHGYGKGMCHGDSGSALVDRLLRLIGVVSWGWPCARGLPDIFARISGLEGFLTSELGVNVTGSE